MKLRRAVSPDGLLAGHLKAGGDSVVGECLAECSGGVGGCEERVVGRLDRLLAVHLKAGGDSVHGC